MKSLFNRLIRQYLAARYSRLENIRNSPVDCQKQVLQSLLSRASQTEIGRSCDFNKIKTREDFAKALPMRDYDTHKPEIYRMMDGAADVLWKGKVGWFAKSSGTTSDRSKYIPISDDALYKNHVKCSWDTTSMLYHEDPNCKIFEKKSLIMGGSLASWQGNKKVTVGDVSAILLHRMPAVGRPFYTPDFATAVLEDWEEKIEKMADLCANEDVFMFGGVPTWTIVLFKKILEKTGKNNINEVWPNVSYYMHGGVGFEPYVKQFKEFLPDSNFKYFEVYNASEGYFSVQDGPNVEGMLLMTDNDIYYEFVSMDEIDKEVPEVTFLEDVEIGRNYALVISNSSGLWRYLVGDTVQFVSKNPFRIKVSGRTKHFINVFGEEVMVGNTDRALAETNKALPAKVTDYTVAPIFMEGGRKGGHLWLIEFEHPPDNLEAYALMLDENMKQVNSDYAAKRHKDIALKRLEIKAVRPGTFHNWLKSKGKFGGQNKVPRLFNTTKYVDELLSLQN